MAIRHRIALIVLGSLTVLAAGSGASLGYFLNLDLPRVQALEDYTPPLMTRVVARDGSPVATFAEQRRILIEYSDIPEVFRHALIASEDSEFLHHPGLDFRGIARAAWHDLTSLRAAQGASTLTQQLARNLFLHPKKTFHRKLQEMFLALEIERTYAKEEILRFYCNQVYMGHGRYGLEAASRYYFAKHARELDLAEAALLAGIIQRPESLSPHRHPERALARREYVLGRMFTEGHITRELFLETRALPLGLASRQDTASPAPYFVEEIRRWLQARKGEAAVYRAGLEVRATLDPRLQEIANRAVDRGLRELDKRQGWRGVASRVPEGEDPATWESPAWSRGVVAGEITEAVVGAVSRGRARVRVGPYEAELGPEQISWTGRKDPSSVLSSGDRVQVRIVEIDARGNVDLTLEQDPLVEGALVALDPSTGAIRALVGGHDFEKSEFDRAIQARRQTGSAFKPFIYAAALTQGLTLADRILDEPTVFLDARTLDPYQPENYGSHYYGTLTLREALEKSANIATVKLLMQIGYQPVLDMSQKLGISAPLRPYPSLALGAFEISLLELTSAYATFANNGVHVEPHLVSLVLSPDGEVLERAEPQIREAVSPQIAYLMTRSLEGVVTDGTGAAAASLGRPLAGKTGTTDDCTDAWFVGYAPDLALGVWVGFDVMKSLGPRETGALAALPIWMAFMEEAYEGRPAEEFSRPPGISVIAVDHRTGLKASPAAGCSPVVPEVFLVGSEPTEYCSLAEHLRLRLPYPLQRYALNERGALSIPENDLETLLATEPSVFLADAGNRIEAITPAGPVSLPLHRAPPREVVEVLPVEIEEKVATEEQAWVGHDGRKARLVVVR